MSSLPPEVPVPALNVTVYRLREVGRAMEAYSELCVLRNTQDTRHPEMDKEVQDQRSALLDVACRVVWSEIISELDEVCEQYLAIRGRQRQRGREC